MGDTDQSDEDGLKPPLSMHLHTLSINDSMDPFAQSANLTITPLACERSSYASSSTRTSQDDYLEQRVAKLQADLEKSNLENKLLRLHVEKLNKMLEAAQPSSSDISLPSSLPSTPTAQYLDDPFPPPFLPLLPPGRSTTEPKPITEQADFKAIFESTPNPLCILDTNSPTFTVVAANDAYLKVTLRKRHQLIGKPLFQVFPDNPDNENTPGESSLRVSFMRVIATRQADAMAVQKYDVEDPIGSGIWNQKWWTPINFPIFTPSGKLYLMHRVEEVTAFMMEQENKKDFEHAETRQHVKRVEDSQERYVRLTTLLPIGVFHTSAEGRLSYVNERWEKIIGRAWSDVSIEDKAWYDYLPVNQRDTIENNWRKTLNLPFQAEYHAINPDSWYMIHLVPERSQRGNLKGYLGYIVDVTERKHAEDAARKRAEQLAELDRQKTMFFSNISHELRTPLTLILGPAEDSLSESGRQALQPRQRERMEVIQRSAQRLLKLVNSSLDFTRLEEGRLSSNFEPTDLIEFTDLLVRLFKPAMENAGLSFHVDTRPISEHVYIDRDLWQKILFNLLSNALKYTLKGGVYVNLRQENDNVVLVVQDTGIGIPSVEMPNMFQRFHRVANADGRSHEGAGIGLSLTQQLVKLHGGTIDVASELGKGSVFTVTIPLGKSHLPADRIREQASCIAQPGLSAQLFVKEALTWLPEHIATASPAITGQVVPRMRSDFSPRIRSDGSPRIRSDGSPKTCTDVSSKMRLDLSPPRLHIGTPPTSRSISPAHSPSPLAAAQREVKRDALMLKDALKVLVADDNADMRKLLYNLLSTEYIVVVAADGEEAWKATKTEKFDLVVSDLMMPKMDGFQLIKALRSDEKTQTLPVILLSARVDEDSRLRGLQLGADDFVVKPFSKRELMERVGGRLRVGRWRHQLTQELHDFQDESQRQKRLLQLVSHELRNPLVGIKGNSELVEGLLENIETTLQERDPRDPVLAKVSESRAAIRIVLQCTDYQKIVCDDVLDMAKLKDSKMELHLTSFDPSQIVKDAVRMLSVRAQQGEIKLTAECQMKPRIVSGDATRLTQVLVNLISNAIKFTPKKGSISVTLHSPSETAEKIELQFVVKDTGMGMSEEQQAKIFSPFTQASAAIASQFGGTGLGLSISKSLVELMGGQIQVTSALGQGSTFTATVYCGNVFVVEQAKPAAKQAEQKKLVVLVVDDTIINQRILKRMLEVAGHQCFVANNGQEGLNLWSQMVKIDAILMDLNMPIMGGLEATQCIRQAEQQKPEHAPTHIIGLSGDNADSVAWREAGMNDYVVKPYNQKDLLEKLQAAAQ